MKKLLFIGLLLSGLYASFSTLEARHHDCDKTEKVEKANRRAKKGDQEVETESIVGRTVDAAKSLWNSAVATVKNAFAGNNEETIEDEA